MVDKEAWVELGDIYLESLEYNRALYCYENLMLLAPKNFHYYIKVAEILYTIGGADNLTLAKHYYSLVISYQPKNVSALFGLTQTCKTIEKLKKGDQNNKVLLDLTTKTLKNVYSKSKSSDLFACYDKA